MKIGKIANFALSCAVVVSCAFQPGNAQKVGFISSAMIRDKFPEAKQTDQRIQSFVEEWKRELASLQKQIDDLDFEIKKNRLVWSDEERVQKENELQKLKEQREGYAKAKFQTGGEYDLVAKQLSTPVEEKIYAAVQTVAAQNNYDIIIDQSVQPLPYVNFKYDLTLKVLRNLGVDVDDLEKDQQLKISKDPRNDVKTSKKPRRVSRTKSGQSDSEGKDQERDFEQNPAPGTSPAIGPKGTGGQQPVMPPDTTKK